jgi:hypothetical protein
LEKWGRGSTAIALISQRGRCWWRGQIPGEGWCYDGGGGQKSNRGGVACGVLRREDGGGEKNRGAVTSGSAPFKRCHGKQREGETGVEATRGGRRSTRRGA